MMNNILIKTEEEIQKIRAAGKIAASVLTMIEPYIQPGILTLDLDKICHDFIVREKKVIPASLNYNGFPKSICTSVNEVVAHGIPDGRVLRENDIVNIDVGIFKDGYYADASKMYPVGKISSTARKLIQISKECMNLGIHCVRPNAYLGDIGAAIQSHAEKNGFSVVREYTGHGVGKSYHEPLRVFHYGKPETGMKLVPGMIFTIEPAINLGKRHVEIKSDGWSIVTKDLSLSAQWEHTVLVTEVGYEVMTMKKEEVMDFPDFLPN